MKKSRSRTFIRVRVEWSFHLFFFLPFYPCPHYFHSPNPLGMAFKARYMTGWVNYCAVQINKAEGYLLFCFFFFFDGHARGCRLVARGDVPTSNMQSRRLYKTQQIMTLGIFFWPQKPNQSWGKERAAPSGAQQKLKQKHNHQLYAIAVHHLETIHNSKDDSKISVESHSSSLLIIIPNKSSLICNQHMRHHLWALYNVRKFQERIYIFPSWPEETE